MNTSLLNHNTIKHIYLLIQHTILLPYHYISYTIDYIKTLYRLYLYNYIHTNTIQYLLIDLNTNSFR